MENNCKCPSRQINLLMYVLGPNHTLIGLRRASRTGALHCSRSVCMALWRLSIANHSVELLSFRLLVRSPMRYAPGLVLATSRNFTQPHRCRAQARAGEQGHTCKCSGTWVSQENIIIWWLLLAGGYRVLRPEVGRWTRSDMVRATSGYLEALRLMGARVKGGFVSPSTKEPHLHFSQAHQPLTAELQSWVCSAF